MATLRFRSMGVLAALVLAVAGSLGLGWSTFRSRGLEPRPGTSPGASAEAPKPAPEPARLLDQPQREYLWEVEHRGLLLGKIGFGPIADALKANDAKALRALMSADFQGHTPRATPEQAVGSGLVRAVHLSDLEHSPEPLGPDALIARLREIRGPFIRRPGVKLSLMGLAPADRNRMDGPWDGTCLLRIWGETAPGAPAEASLHLRYRVARPDETPYQGGGWLKGCDILHGQFVRSSRPLFREVAAERGLNPEALYDNWKSDENTPLPVTGGECVFDYDRDGRLDVLITDVNGYTLYRGEDGGRFRDVTSAAGLPRATPTTFMGKQLTVTAADLDGDGWEDVILGDMIFRNVEGRQFDRVPVGETNLRLTPPPASVIPADYDRDGRIDLYLTYTGVSGAASWLDGKTGTPLSNQLWHNEGDWEFRNVTESSGTSGGSRSVFTALWLDANDDGWPDLYVPNEFGNGLLLVNRHDGTFRESALCDAPCDFGTMGATCGDIDNDGRIDLYAANMYSKAGSRVIGNLWPGTYPDAIMAKMRRFVTGNQLHHNLGGQKFEQLGAQYGIAAVGWSYGPALLDYDNDGWLDIFSTCGFVSQDRDKPDG